MTSHNESDHLSTLERLRARVRRIVTRSEREEVLARQAQDEITDTEAFLAALSRASSEMAPGELISAFTAPIGEQRVVTLSVCGAVVATTINARGDHDPDRDIDLWGWLHGYTALCLSTPPIIWGNVLPYPRRAELPIEFAAISIKDDESQRRVLVVNTLQSQGSAKAALRKLRPGVIIPVFAGATANRIARTTQRNHGAVSLVAAVAAAAAAVGATAMLTEREEPQHQPGAIRVVTPPPVTVTVTASSAVPKPPTSPAPTLATQAPGITQALRPWVRSVKPSSRDSPPSTRPTSLRPTPTEVERSQQPPPSQQPTRSSVPSPPASREAAPSPSANPPPTENTSGNDDCDGLVHVHLDPLADACLLG